MSFSLQLAQANDRLDAPITATKMWAGRGASARRVHDHRHGVTGVVDKELLAAQVGLAHGHGKPAFPAAVEFAEAAVLVAVRLPLDVLVPEDLQRDVFALQLAIEHCPVGLRLPPVTVLAAALAVETHLKLLVADLHGDRPR